MPRGLMILVTRFGRIHRQPLMAEGVHWHIIGPDAGDPVVRNWLGTQAIDLPVSLHEGKPHWEDEANRQRNWVQRLAQVIRTPP